jgi:hypothetical protein
MPDRVDIEEGALTPAVITELTRRGQNVHPSTDAASVNAVLRMGSGPAQAVVDARAERNDHLEPPPKAH